MARTELLAMVVAIEATLRQWGLLANELFAAVEKLASNLPKYTIPVDLEDLRRDLTFVSPRGAPIQREHYELVTLSLEFAKRS